MAEKPDLQGCESCDKELPIEQMTSMEDCWFCPGCVEAFQKEFDACDHRWKPHTSTMGEPGRVCERCSGFVADEDAAAVGV